MDAPVPARDRAIAAVCQLWCWLGPLMVVTVVVRFTVARDSRFLRQVTGEVLNLQLVVVFLASLVVVAVLAGAEAVALGLWACFFAVAAYGYAVGVVGAVRAWRGTAWTYPVNLHLIADR